MMNPGDFLFGAWKTAQEPIRAPDRAIGSALPYLARIFAAKRTKN
jgi:hypothetical protein